MPIRGKVIMGARWAWTAVCSGPEHHVYSNFSGGADDCYECGAEPEMEWQDDMDAGHDGGAQLYAERRRRGVAREEIDAESELRLLKSLADRLGYTLVKAG